MDEDIRVRFHASHDVAGLFLPEEIEATLYRVAREAVTNVVRHSGASEASITLSVAGNDVVLAVRDDGRGFAVPADRCLVDGGHLGLVGMRDRVQQIGGYFDVISAPCAQSIAIVRVAETA